MPDTGTFLGLQVFTNCFERFYFYHWQRDRTSFMNEKALIALLKKEDHSAIKTIFDHYHPLLCKLAYTIVKDTDPSKDIVQAVFIKLWRNRATLEITGSLEAYLRRATVNTALNYLESNNRQKKQELEKSDLSTFSSNTTEKDLAYDELNQKVNESIRYLPIRTRTVFTLIRSEEMSYKEVGATLNISIKAVEKEMMKALRLLREALKDYLYTLLIISIMHSL